MGYSPREWSKIGYPGVDIFPIIGQSNAVGQGLQGEVEPSAEAITMFGNDYLWKVAYEPTDDNTDQVDTVSRDNNTSPDPANLGHSTWLLAAKTIYARLDCSQRIAIVPCAKGTTLFRTDPYDATSWEPRPNLLDRTSLFGSANHRVTQEVLKGNDVPKCIWMMGHETSTETSWGSPPQDYLGFDQSDTSTSTYKTDLKNYIQNFRDVWGANVPVVYSQLGPSNYGPDSATITNWYETDTQWKRLFWGREFQRQAESEIDNCAMVTTFDLPMDDSIHLNRAALDILAERVALATLRLAYKEPVFQRGPYPVSHRVIGSDIIEVVFDRPIQDDDANDFGDQFTVWSEAAGAYLPLVSAVRTGADDELNRVARITTTLTIGGFYRLFYGQSKRGTDISNLVVRAYDGLPAPSFYLTNVT